MWGEETGQRSKECQYLRGGQPLKKYEKPWSKMERKLGDCGVLEAKEREFQKVDSVQQCQMQLRSQKWEFSKHWIHCNISHYDHVESSFYETVDWTWNFSGQKLRSYIL